MDLHTSNLFRMVRSAADKHTPTRGPELPAPWRDAGPDFPVIKVDYIAGGIEVPEEDDDVPVRPAIVRWMIWLNNALTPFSDKPILWESPAAGQQELVATFGKYLPEVLVNWPESGADLVSYWGRQGLGAQDLAKTDGSVAGEAFVSSFEHMAKYEVRPGLTPYGGAAYFDAEGNVTRIHFRGTDYRVDEDGFEMAGFAWRTSSLVWTTLCDHVFGCHFVATNTLVLATKRVLPKEHPLRKLVTPFHYRTAAINNGGTMTLVPKHGLFHRVTGCTWEQLQELYSDAVASYKFESFPNKCRSKGVHPEQLGENHAILFPYASDGCAYWDEVVAFVSDVFDSCESMTPVCAGEDPLVLDWWEQIGTIPGGLPEFNRESLTTLLSNMIFTATGFHEQVGNVSQYVGNPALCGGKIWPNQEISDKQGSYQLSVVACLTGLPMPKLLEDFGHLMPDGGGAEALHRFQDRLRALDKKVVAQNEKRKLPYLSFLPSQMACSVSI